MSSDAKEADPFYAMDGTERLCRAVYERQARARDYIGGSEARMLHDAADEIDRLRIRASRAEAEVDFLRREFDSLSTWSDADAEDMRETSALARARSIRRLTIPEREAPVPKTPASS